MIQKQSEELEEKLKQKQLIVSKHLSDTADIKSKVKEVVKYQMLVVSSQYFVYFTNLLF